MLMNNTLPLSLKSGKTLRTLIMNIAAFLFIFLVPAISHLIMLPVYYVEPMRLMLVLMLLHTGRANAYIIAVSLPLFSFMLSGHPVLPKMLLIASELALNVFVFFYLKDRLRSVPGALISSILISKVFYYFVKYLLINAAILSTSLVGIPLYAQIIMMLILTGYAWLIIRKQQAAS